MESLHNIQKHNIHPTPVQIKGGVLSPTLFNIYTSGIPPLKHSINAPTTILKVKQHTTITSMDTSKQPHSYLRKDNMHSLHT